MISLLVLADFSAKHLSIDLAHLKLIQVKQVHSKISEQKDEKKKEKKKNGSTNQNVCSLLCLIAGPATDIT